MGDTNTSLSHFIILASMSFSMNNISYDQEINVNMVEKHTPSPISHTNEQIQTTTQSSGIQTYEIRNRENKTDDILSFADRVISNSKDLEDEYVDVVNNNFWDLI